MNAAFAKTLLFTSLFFTLSAHAEIDAETRKEILSNTYQETQTFFALFSAVDKHCSEDTAKRLVGTALVTFKTDFMNLSRFADTKATPQCKLATEQFKNNISKIYKENKWLLIKLVKSINRNPEFDQKLACADLPVGKTRRPLLSSYRVRHMRNREYLVQFDLKFIASQGVAKNHELAMRTRVNQCLAQTGYFQDHTGNKIKLQVVQPGSGRSIGIVQKTVYLSENIRSNSGNYDINLSCAGIIHEILHLAGLWDEYDEAGFNCRAHGDSIMSDHWDYSFSRFGFLDLGNQTNSMAGYAGANPLEAVFEAQPHEIELTQVNSISCSNDQNRSWNILERESNGDHALFKESNGAMIFSAFTSDKWATYIPSKDLNFNTPTSKKNYVTRLMKLDKNINWNCEITPDTASPKILGSQLITKSVYPIRPAHFRKIVYPSCIEKNRRYDTCTKEAYTKPAAGYQCIKDKNPICQNERFLD